MKMLEHMIIVITIDQNIMKQIDTFFFDKLESDKL